MSCVSLTNQLFLDEINTGVLVPPPPLYTFILVRLVCIYMSDTNLREIYTYFVEEEKKRVAMGNKADTIRTFVKLLSAQFNETKLVRSATWHALKNKHEEKNITQSYFGHVVSEEWETICDKDGVIWIDLTRPRRRK